MARQILSICSAKFMVSCPAGLDAKRRKLGISGSVAVQRGFKEILAEREGKESNEMLRKKIEVLVLKIEEQAKEIELLRPFAQIKESKRGGGINGSGD